MKPASAADIPLATCPVLAPHVWRFSGLSVSEPDMGVDGGGGTETRTSPFEVLCRSSYCSCNPARVGTLSVDGRENVTLDRTFFLDSALDNIEEPLTLLGVASGDAVETV